MSKVNRWVDPQGSRDFYSSGVEDSQGFGNPFDNPFGERAYRAIDNYSGPVGPLSRFDQSARITPLTRQAAIELGYDPDVPNAPLARRLGALLIDGALYSALVIFLAVAVAGFVDPALGETIALATLVLGPVGFYAFRSAGDAIFEGSPGKHILGMSMSGPHGLPVSGRDGLLRNAWILPSMIPFLGWVASLGVAAWIAISAARDPLGRGIHEKGARTRVVEKPDSRHDLGGSGRREIGR
nr:RDD family protein [Corynebacterium lactis]